MKTIPIAQPAALEYHWLPPEMQSHWPAVLQCNSLFCCATILQTCLLNNNTTNLSAELNYCWPAELQCILFCCATILLTFLLSYDVIDFSGVQQYYFPVCWITILLTCLLSYITTHLLLSYSTVLYYWPRCWTKILQTCMVSYTTDLSAKLEHYWSVYCTRIGITDITVVPQSHRPTRQATIITNMPVGPRNPSLPAESQNTWSPYWTWSAIPLICCWAAIPLTFLVTNELIDLSAMVGKLLS